MHSKQQTHQNGRLITASRKTRQEEDTAMDTPSILIKDTTREERIKIVREALWGGCATECEFCSGCDIRGG